MAGPFEGVARAAIEELIESHSQTSKFGLILSRDSMKDLVDGLYDLLVTSRNLKAAGDRFLSKGGGAADQPRAGARPVRPVRPR